MTARGWGLRSCVARELLAELLGTAVLVLLGSAAAAQTVLSLHHHGGQMSSSLGWGLGVTLGMTVAGGVSGGHLNPAITVAMASVGRFPWWKVPHYLAGQYLGALVSSGLVFLVYWDALVWYEHDRGEYRSLPDTASIFSSFPGQHLSTGGAVLDQVVSAGLLLLSLSAITDPRNLRVGREVVPPLSGLTVLALGISLGHNCFSGCNPARDLAARLFTWLAGWGAGVFTYPTPAWWLLAPMLATHVGAVAGAWLYRLMVELHWPDQRYDSVGTGGSDSQASQYRQYENGYPAEQPGPATPTKESFQAELSRKLGAGM